MVLNEPHHDSDKISVVELVEVASSEPSEALSNMDLFIQKLELSGASVDFADTYSGVPGAIEAYLKAHGGDQEINTSDRVVADLEWPDLSQISFGSCDQSVDVSVSRAFAGVTETGTLMLSSSMNVNTSSLFLPRISVVLVEAETVVASLEDAWRLKRASSPKMPRSINLITGPSRTGDIEQKIEIGAHGPVELHVIVINRS